VSVPPLGAGIVRFAPAESLEALIAETETTLSPTPTLSPSVPASVSVTPPPTISPTASPS
jgi:hypothetical protein